MQRLAVSGQIEPDGAHYRPAEVLSINLRGPRTGASLKQHWAEVAAARAEVDGAMLSYNLFTISEADLIQVLRKYGEEPRARRIARAILDGRPWSSTLALAQCVSEASGYRQSRTHPATRTFQALRMAVNDELGQLERALDQCLRLLSPGGRLAIITFHSLEDRIVKHTLRDRARAGDLELLTKKPLRPTDDESRVNRRSRSAKLRGARRVGRQDGGER